MPDVWKKWSWGYVLGVLALVGAQATDGLAKSKAAKATITYTGSGFASYQDAYSRNASNPCQISATENASSVQWSVTWNKAALVDGTKPTSATFSAASSRTDGSGCPASGTSCSATLQYFQGVLPGLGVKKSKKSFIVTVLAEQQTEGANATAAECMQSSIFDNNIVEGMNGIAITAVKLQLKPSGKNKKTTIPVSINKTFDCTDPSRNGPPFVYNHCTLMTSFTGSAEAQGKWKVTAVSE